MGRTKGKYGFAGPPDEGDRSQGKGGYSRSVLHD